MDSLLGWSSFVTMAGPGFCSLASSTFPWVTGKCLRARLSIQSAEVHCFPFRHSWMAPVAFCISHARVPKLLWLVRNLGMSLSWRQCPLSQRTSKVNRKLQSARGAQLICRLTASCGKLPLTAVLLYASSCWIILFLTNMIQKQPAELLNQWITSTRWSECESTEGNLKTGKRALRGQTLCHADDGLQKNLLILPDELAHPIYCNIRVNVQENCTTAKL